jgi:hypothetical protein
MECPKSHGWLEKKYHPDRRSWETGDTNKQASRVKNNNVSQDLCRKVPLSLGLLFSSSKINLRRRLGVKADQREEKLTPEKNSKRRPNKSHGLIFHFCCQTMMKIFQQKKHKTIPQRHNLKHAGCSTVR